MRRRFPLIVLPALLLGGCATGPPAPEYEGPPVPVFQFGDEMPCEYEVVGRVRAERARQDLSEIERRQDMSRALGRAGAEAGADAVILDRPRETGLLMTVRGTQRPTTPARLPPYEGNAVRWIPETCKRS